MRRHQISAKKRNGMRRQFIEGTFSSFQAAKDFNVSTITSWRYMKEFQRIKQQYPNKLKDMDFYIPEPPRPHRSTPLYNGLVHLLPILLSYETTKLLNPKNVWRRYKLVYPLGYNYTTFKSVMYKWISENVTPVKVKLLYNLPESDYKQLQAWRLSNNHRCWQIAMVLNAAFAGDTVMQIMEKADCARKTVNDWLNTYQTKGLSGFDLPKRKPNEKVVKIIQQRKNSLTRLINETPKLYGLNRTSWSITALTEVYNRVNIEPVTYMQISRCLHQMGYRYKNSREMLTSQDPNFRVKINKIQHILQHLKPNEKFFSIDEYGPVTIKLKGGATLVHKKERPTAIPQKQKIKGVVICTAALELSTNQVTYFYSQRKNTFETIKLIDMLVEQYRDQKRLYLCWDAVSWHNSKILKNHLEDLNSKEYRELHLTPQIKLAPLPACTQFLNVIESVFGGLARAVIHNSDYESVDEAKEAISLHFEARNKHYLEQPKRAGNKIWGKELVVPRFNDTQVCRRTSAMRGAR